MTFYKILAVCAALSGCVSTTQTAPEHVNAETLEKGETVRPNGRGMSFGQFQTVAARIQPIAKTKCRAESRFGNCNFLIVMDDRAKEPANAYQFLTDDGQPILAVTVALLNEVRNVDELAFIVGHEAAHHVAGHLEQQNALAYQGALLGGFTAAILGGDDTEIEKAENFGAFVASRQYSKDYEIEADALGAIIAIEAGYDPLRGVAYFSRIPDPGNKFLGTHPPNKDRIAAVRAAVANS